jgi:hypothetical protein
MFEYLKAYLEFFTLTKSWRHTGYFMFAWYCFSMFSMSFIFVLFMLHLLTVCALYVCLCHYVNICMYLVLLCIFGKKLVYCYTAANMNVFLPYLVVLTWGTSNMFEYLKAYLEFFTLTKSWRHTGANLLTMLYVSKAIVLIRLICKEGRNWNRLSIKFWHSYQFNL